MTNEERIEAEVERVAKELSEFKDWDGAREFIKNGWRYKVRQILLGHNLAIIVPENEIDNEAWHRSEREYEAYQAGKNDVRASIVYLEEIEK